jgi:hypothetical protein
MSLADQLCGAATDGGAMFVAFFGFIVPAKNDVPSTRTRTMK